MLRAVESLVIHLHVAIVLRTEDALGVRQAHNRLKEFLIIQATIPDQAHRQVRKEGVGEPKELPFATPFTYG